MDDKINSLKNKNIVKIVNNTQPNSILHINHQKNSNSHHPINEPSTSSNVNTNIPTNANMNNKKSFVDDHNNNQLNVKMGNNQSNQSAAAVSAAAVARIQSNGMGSVNSNSIQKNLITSNTNASVTSSFSNGSNSFASNSSVYPTSNNNNVKTYNHVAHITKSTDSTLENSSIAVINVNNLENSSIRPGSSAKNTITNELNDSKTTVQHQNNRPAASMEAIGRTTTVQPTISTNSRYVNQQTRPSNDKENLANATDVDGVKYKFISNETIGAKNSPNNEFCDVNSESASGKFSKCSKCLKRCFVM